VSTISAVLTAKAKLEVQASLSRESDERRKAEATSALALEALDNIFDRFAPDRIVATSNYATIASGGDQFDIPVQPVLSPEAVALLEEMLTFYGRVATETGDRAAIRLKVAEANRRIGEIHQRLGNSGEAQAAYSRAHDLYLQLREEAGDDTQFRCEIAGILNRLGTLQSAMGEPDKSRTTHEQALALLDAADSAQAAAPQLRVELASTYYCLGKRDGRKSGPGPTGRPPHRRPPGEAPPRPVNDAARQDRMNDLRQAVEILDRLVEEYPSVPDYQLMLACCCRDLPAPRRGESGPGSLDRATQILRRLVADFPAIPEYRYELCETLAGGRYRGRRSAEEQYPAVEQHLSEALQVSAELVAKHPNIPDYAASQVRIHHRLAQVYRHTDRQDEAEANLRKALELQAALAQRFPDVISYRVWTAVIQEALAKRFRQRGQLDDARSLLEASVSTLNDCLAKDSNSDEIRDLLAHNLDVFADVLARLGDEDAAEQVRRRAREYRGEQ